MTSIGYIYLDFLKHKYKLAYLHDHLYWVIDKDYVRLNPLYAADRLITKYHIGDK